MTGRDFIVLSDTLEGLPTSSLHLFKNIAKDNRVFWFNILTRLPGLSWLDFCKMKRAFFSWFTNGQDRSISTPKKMGIQVVSPVMIPWFTPLVRKINCHLLLKKFRQLESEWKIKNPIFFTTFPAAADFFKSCPQSTKVYYCVDDFLNYPGIQHQRWREMESVLLQHVDGLVVTSKHLSSKSSGGLPLLHLPHGVDHEHFKKTNSTLHFPVQCPKRLVVGFFGLISDWVDLDLIAYLSDCFSDVSFLIIGRAELSIEKIRDRNNVTVVDHVSYEDLPGYASQFDIGLIPFIINDLTKAVNPLKLLEYYALGLPVVSTKLPELIGFPGPIKLATTKEEFRDNLALTIKELSEQQRLEAELIAEKNSWEARVQDLYCFLNIAKHN